MVCYRMLQQRHVNDRPTAMGDTERADFFVAIMFLIAKNVFARIVARNAI